MSVLVIPTLGPFHILHPRYNAVSVLEVVKSHQPSQIMLASYSPDEFSAKTWRDQGETSFFHVLPWAERAKVPVLALDQLAHLRTQAEEFRKALEKHPKGQEAFRHAEPLEAQLKALLLSPKSPEDFSRPEVLQVLIEYVQGYAQLFGEGPATGFRQQRMEAVSNKLQATSQEPSVVLVDLLDYPVLLNLLPAASRFPLPAHTPTEAQRQRSILDRAWQLLETDDWAILINQLQEVDGPEAQYCAAQIFLASGQSEDAFELLDQLAHSDFQEPEYLPGYTLARYGQLADVLGQRDKALRAYRAVLALDWAPLEAREIALAGQRTPYQLGR